jgi:hypothetical protein
MIEIIRKDGSWIKFSCPEWNYLSPAAQKDIIRKLQENPVNIIWPRPETWHKREIVRSHGELKTP